MRRHALPLGILSLTAAASTGCGRAAPAAAPEAEGLAARVEALGKLIPDQAHIMADVGDHFVGRALPAATDPHGTRGADHQL